ncbi:hypothetical protein [Mesorhizobium sp. IMUNJ 23232]|uniref:hypothetical protein n=1 Tax=Mesorhizobium sp. IMUNJ 23232 TaxID=3376064 RepID=UPI0037B34B72
MLDWLDEIAGPGYSQAIVVTLLALVGLILLLFVIRLMRSTFSGTFVAGGRNRKTRLAVMDATAVDSHRRLILVRRDDIEHLLLIGGTTDIVVERDIRIGQQRRPAAPAEPVREPQAPQPAAVLPPAPAAPARRPPEPLRAAPPPIPLSPAPSPSPNRIPAQAAPRPPEMLPQRPVARPELTRPAAPVGAVRPESRAAPVLPPAPTLRSSPAPAAPDNDLDDALLKELEVSLDDSETRSSETKGGKPAPSLDEEMAKLLGELSNPRR